MARDLKLTAVLVDKVSSGLKQAAKDWQAIAEAPIKATAAARNSEAVKAKTEADKQTKQLEKNFKDRLALVQKSSDNEQRILDKYAKEKIARQRASIALAEKQEKEAAAASMRAGEKSLRASKSQEDAALKIQRQAAVAESALVLNKFDRMIAKEKQIHAHRLSDLKGNDAAIEAEIRRHNAVVGRMSMDKANFPNTPFQMLLGHLNKVTSMMGIQLPQAVNTASASMAGAGASSAGLAIGLAAAGAATVALGGASIFAYKQAREQIDANNALNAILKSTAGAAGLTFDQLDKMASKLQDTTDFSDDAAMSAEVVLLRFDSIGRDIFPAALKATADLAAHTHDLAGAASMLGQALEAPEDATRKLKSMDIILSDAQKKVIQGFIDIGEKAKAQKVILDLVAKSYGDNAELMSHATVKLGNRIGDLAERFGMQLVPIVDFAADAINDLITPDAPKKAKEYWDSQKLGALGFKLGMQDLADMKAKEKAAEPPAPPKPPKQLSEEQIKASKEAADTIARNVEKANDAHNQFVLDNQRKQLAARQKERDELKASEEEKTKIKQDAENQRGTAVFGLSMAKATNPIEQLRARQEQELSLITDKAAREATIERHGIELKRANAEEEAAIYQAKTGYYAAYANSVSQLAGVIGGSSKATFLIQKGLALGEIGINTASAIVKDNVSAPWKIPFDIALGASQAAVVAATALQGFEQGGYTGNGGRSDVAGVVHGGEMVWSQDDVRRAGGRQAAENIRQGGSMTVSAPINIVIQGSADANTVKAIGVTVEQKLKEHAWLTREVQTRRITA